MNFADLKTKEIISITTGKRLGYPDDVVLDTVSNTIHYFVITKASKMFKRPEKEQIPFSAVTLIGEDVILVKTDRQVEVKKEESKEERGEFFFSPKVFTKSK